MSGSGDWYSELLYMASRKAPEKRPAIISVEMHEVLNESKAFRHLFRHAYAKELRWRKMDHMVLDINQVWSSFGSSITEFIVFLQKVVDEPES